MELTEALALLTKNTIDATKPCAPFEAIVSSIEPLTISRDTLIIPRANIILAKGLSLKIGDRVLCIRATGGQKYYVICEVENNDTY